MNNDQVRNKNAWDQIYRNQYSDTYVPEGYAPAQGYTSVGGQSGYSDYQSSTTNPYGAHQMQEVSELSDSEASATSSYGTHQNASTVDDDDITEEEIREFVSSRKSQAKAKEAKPKNKQPKSARGQRREKVAKENNGEVSATDAPKGRVEWREGVFYWYDPIDNDFKKAAFHDQYRSQFIREDMTEGTYVVAPERGKGADDITSVCSAFNQLEWRITDRETWGNIVDSDDNKVLYLISRPDRQHYDEPERLWIHDGFVLLDGDNNPVRPWAGIPRCFSSKIEGGRIEALRRILPMTLQDIRARCPRTVSTSAGDTKPLSLPSTFGHRSSRFRAQYQVPTWTPRAASAVLKKQVTDLLPEAEEATTTEGLQALSRYEVERRKSSTRGRFLYKANGRALSEDERKERDRKLEDKLQRQAARGPIAGNKRPVDDEFNDSEPAGKRSRLPGHFPASLPVHEDQYPQAPNAYDAPERLTQQPEAPMNTGRTASSNGSHQLDYGFVDPQNPLEQWNGSFDMAPIPDLPDELLWTTLHPTPAPLPVPDMMATDHHAQGSPPNAVAEEILANPGFSTGLQYDTESHDWDDDLFGDYIEDFE